MDSDGTKADVFNVARFGFDFNVEYKDNIAWVVTFHGRKVRRTMADSLVAKNCGAKVQSGEFLSGKYWIEKEKKLRAFYYSAPMPRLVVMTEESLKSKRTPRDIILKALPNVLPAAAGNQKQALSGTKNDPFAQFSVREVMPLRKRPKRIPKKNQILRKSLKKVRAYRIFTSDSHACVTTVHHYLGASNKATRFF